MLVQFLFLENSNFLAWHQQKFELNYGVLQNYRRILSINFFDFDKSLYETRIHWLINEKHKWQEDWYPAILSFKNSGYLRLLNITFLLYKKHQTKFWLTHWLESDWRRVTTNTKTLLTFWYCDIQSSKISTNTRWLSNYFNASCQKYVIAIQDWHYG